MPDDLILSLQAIAVRYQDRLLFRNLNFQVRTGENWALVGAGGSGKSTLLDTIAGKFPVVEGQVSYPFFERYRQEHAITDPFFTRHKLIARVSSRHAFRTMANTTDLYYQQRFNSSDIENIVSVETYLAAIKPYTATPSWTLERVTERLQLAHLLDKQLILLSNGETKRLLLAAALLQNPVVLLLDHPLTGLDVATRSDFNSLLTEIARSGITVIMATAPAELPEAVTHVAVLADQKIIKQVARPRFKAADVDTPGPRPAALPALRELLALRPLPTFRKLVQLQDIVLKYGDKLILDRVNWQVNSGERWALVGPNGAGKSALLSLINGDNPQAYANKIILFDRERGKGESIWDIKKQIGFVSPELFQYFPTGISCRNVILSGFYDTMGLFRKPTPVQVDLAQRWMQLLEIAPYGDTLLRHVPVSIQRWYLLVRALVKNPPLLILDEPVQGLDTHQQQHFKQVVDTICTHSPVALIYVSHYPHEIPASVTRILQLEKGQVVAPSGRMT